MKKETRHKKSCGTLPHEILMVNGTVPEAWQAQYPVPPSSDPAPLYTHQTGLHRSKNAYETFLLPIRVVDP
jgi:hypothetical protein